MAREWGAAGKRKKGGQTRTRHSRSEEPDSEGSHRELPDTGQQSVGSSGGRVERALGDLSPLGSEPCLLFIVSVEGGIFRPGGGCLAVSQASSGSPHGPGYLQERLSGSPDKGMVSMVRGGETPV